MVKFNLIYIFSVYMFLSITMLESHSRTMYRNHGCPTIQLNNGRVKLRSAGRMARITCNRSFKLVQGSDLMACVRGQWDTEPPICARTGCTTVLDNISHGKLIVVDEAKLEVECDVGYNIDGLSFTYCNELNEWNDVLKGCKENDRIYSSCDFESSDGRLCGWQNDRFNDVDWLADKMSYAFFSNRRHVTPGSSQYFTNNYISLDAGNYGSTTFGRLISPQIPPVESKQRCLIFSYKVISGSSYGTHTLTVTFGNVPHWTTSEGEGRVIIGLYKFNITSQIIIEGKSCKAAIDNIVITEGYSCSQKPYEDESDTCHDNCGKISYDDNSCSCDWECHFNDNCCSDISGKCPHIKPLEEINRLYLTTSTPKAVKMTTVFKNTLNSTTSNTTFSSKLINESKISNDPIIVTTPMNKFPVTVNKITYNFTTQNTSISHIHFSHNITTTEKSKDIPKLNNSLIFNGTSFLPLQFTSNSKTTAMTYLDIITNTTSIPKLINNQNITTNNSVNSTLPVVTTSVYGFSSTIKPSVINTTYTLRVLNTSSLTTKSLMEIINSSKSTIISTKSAYASTTNLEGKKSTNTFISTIQPVMTTTSSIIDASIITTKYLIENSTNSIKLIDSPSNMTTYPSKFNESNSFERLNITYTAKYLDVSNITQNDVITESKEIISNSTTLVPNINVYTVSNEDNIVFDVDQPNLNLSHFIYEANTKLYNYKSTLKSNRSPFNNYSIPNETIASTMLNPDNMSTEHMIKSDYSQTSSVSYVVIVIKYLAATGVIFITIKYSLSFIRWYFKKPIDDDMNSCFIKTDSESTCNMELKSHYM